MYLLWQMRLEEVKQQGYEQEVRRRQDLAEVKEQAFIQEQV